MGQYVRGSLHNTCEAGLEDRESTARESVEPRGERRLRPNQVRVICVAKDLALWMGITNTLEGMPLRVCI